MSTRSIPAVSSSRPPVQDSSLSREPTCPWQDGHRHGHWRLLQSSAGADSWSVSSSESVSFRGAQVSTGRLAGSYGTGFPRHVPLPFCSIPIPMPIPMPMTARHENTCFGGVDIPVCPGAMTEQRLKHNPCKQECLPHRVVQQPHRHGHGVIRRSSRLFTSRRSEVCFQ
jgi:hypothetical protein